MTESHPAGLIDFAAPSSGYVIQGDNLRVLPQLPAESFQLIYLDPPFNTGGTQQRRTVRTTRTTEGGDRTGFGGHRYSTTTTSQVGYLDSFDDYLGFLAPRLEQARRLLTPSGTLYFHIDHREAHYCKVLLDGIFGRDAFLNEIIWAYDYGGRARDRWPAKHDTILVYVKTPRGHLFDQEQITRVPYMAPGLVGPEKAARGKLPTDVWWHTIVPTNSKEKTGYPNQKPAGILRRVLAPSSRPGDWVLDFFAGSGTTGAVAAELGRRFVLVDSNPAAIEVMAARLGPLGATFLADDGNPLRTR
ncbi:MAG: DNA-methyltransferase [Candidatus Nanopelagicales bacterium]